LDKIERLDAFLRREQTKAYSLALRSLANHDDALDAVQDAMFKLVDRYADKPLEELAPLFYRILFNRIRDMQRKSSRLGRLFSFSNRVSQPHTMAANEFAQIDYHDEHALSAEQKLDQAALKYKTDRALNNLPQRQRDAFVLRIWLELDVRQTAVVMSCSEGSVKTHLSRAKRALKNQLQDLVEDIGDDVLGSKAI